MGEQMFTLTIDPSNEQALRAWDGADGSYWAEQEEIFDRSVGAYNAAFLAAAAIRPTDRVLDIGCGNGETSRDAARLASSGEVLGVDLSSRMIEVARRRAVEHGLANVRFVQADAQVHPFPAGWYDTAVSRTGTMFFGDPVAAFANIAAALRPGGRLTMLTWKSVVENEWIREFFGAAATYREVPMPPPGAPSPFALSEPDRVRAILDEAGYREVDLVGHEEPMYFGPDAPTALRFILGLGPIRMMLHGVDAYRRAGIENGLRASVERHTTPDGVRYPSSAWVITARRP
jgi:SAM-dependent methyltransferase